MTQHNESTRLVSPLTLDKLEIELQRWGDHKGRYIATVAYSGETGQVKLNLSPELSEDLMRFCGGSIKRFSESAALELNASIEASILEAEKQTSLG